MFERLLHCFKFCLLEELEERTDSETKSQEAQLRILVKEKASLVTKLTDAKAIIVQLEQECTSIHKNLREAHEKISEQKMDLDSARDREVASHERLAKTVSVAEKAIAERETFAKIAKSQQKANERAGVHSALQGATVGRIEREFELYRQTADAKLEKASTILRDKEREHRVQRKKYEREISQLKHQLKAKQHRLGEIAKEKQLSDDRVELMWRAKIEASKADSRAKYYSSLNPVAAAAASTMSGSKTAGHLVGQLSKLSTHVHPT